MKTAHCPSHQQLSAYLNGTLDEVEVRSVVEHVETCSLCDSTLATLEQQPDALVTQLRQTVPEDPFLKEPQCREALRLVMAIGIDRMASDADDPHLRLAGALPLGSRLGDYEILDELGRGGMGTVYKARHCRLDKHVALKVLAAGTCADRRALARFDREMKAVGKLDHPNIVRALDAREESGTYFLIMELIEGLSLSTLVHCCGPLPIADACELIRQAAIGLQAAHQHGLVHRDIKPSNLMLTPHGQVKILDLGLALWERGLVDEGELTDTNQIIGTADYLAPEQVGRSHRVDIRADIYSLGCTLYRLVAGQAPFRGPQHETALEKMLAHAHTPFPSVRGLRPEASEALAAVLGRMVAKAAEDRFATPAEVAAALEPLATGSELKALFEKAVAHRVQACRDEGEPIDRKGSSTFNHVSSAFHDTGPQPIDAAPSKRSSGADSLCPRSDSVAPDGLFAQEESGAMVDSTAGLESAACLAPSVKPLGIPSRRGPFGGFAMVMAAFAAGLLLILGIGIIVKDRQGRVVSELEVPNGATVEVQQDGKTVATILPAAKPDEQGAGSGEPAKARTSSPTGTPGQPLLPPQPVKIEAGLRDITAGSPLSRTALVRHPVPLEAVKSWTIETRDPRGTTIDVAFSPDGRLLAVAGQDAAIRLYQTSDHSLVRVLMGHDDQVSAIAWSPDGTMLASAGFEGIVVFWEATSGRKLRSLRNPAATGLLAWSPNGKFLATSHDRGVRVLEVQTGQVADAMEVTPGGESWRSLCWSPDSQILTYPGDDGKSIELRDLETGRTLHKLVGHTGPIVSAAWSLRGDLIATVARDKTARIWEASSARCLRTIESEGGQGYEIAVWLGETERLAVAESSSPHIGIWDARSGTLLSKLAPPNYYPPYSRIRSSPNGRWVAVTSPGPCSVVDIDSGAAQSYLETHPSACTKLTWSSVDTRLASAYRVDGGGSEWRAWNLSSVFQVSFGRITYPNSLRWLDGRTLFTEEGQLFDVQTDGVVRRLLTPLGETVCNNSGKMVACWGGANMNVRETDSGRVIRDFPKHKSRVIRLSWSPEGERIASMDDSGVLWIWNPRTGEANAAPGDFRHSTDLKWSPEGNAIAFAWGNSIGLFDPASMKVTSQLGVDRGLDSMWASGVAWSPDGKRIASSGWGGIRIWQRETEELSMTFNETGRPARVLEWSPSGRLLATAGDGCPVSLWDAETGGLRGSLVHLSKERWMIVSPQGHYVGSPFLERELVYVVQTDQGQETLSPKEFEKKYGWKNDPQQVKLEVPATR